MRHRWRVFAVTGVLLGLALALWPLIPVELAPRIAEWQARAAEALASGSDDEAVQLAEQAFASELTDLVEHLTERLTGQIDGKPKIFRDSTIENLIAFFRRFARPMLVKVKRSHSNHQF